MLVRKVSSAKPKSLILLDEPETSLHPRAQRELMRFLLEKAERHGHQIVIATHSAECISELPPEAIKVLQTSNEIGDVDLVSQRSLPEVAFNIIGIKHDKRRIYVEDRLAGLFVKYAMSAHGKGYDDFETVPYGAASILTGPLLANLARTGSTDFIVVDGDKNPYHKLNNDCSSEEKCKQCLRIQEEKSNKKSGRKKKIPELTCDEVRRFFNPEGIPIVAEIPGEKYMSVLNHIGCPKRFLGLDSNNGAVKGNQLIERAKEILCWAESNLRYISGKTSDGTLINLTPDALLIKLTQLPNRYCDKDLESNNAKEYWRERAKELFGLDVTSETIYFAQRAALIKSSVTENEIFSSFADSLETMVSSISRVD